MSRQRDSGRKRRPSDVVTAAINLGQSTRTNLKDYVLLDGGTVDPQILQGQFVLFDEAVQRTNLYWAQDQALLETGGYVVVDIAAGSEEIQPEDIVAVFGLGESTETPGTKAVGVGFASPDYPAAVVTSYAGHVRFQNLLIPLSSVVADDFYWPLVDAPDAGSTLTTDANGGLYWTPPANPPNVIEDTDNTDFIIDSTPLWDLMPVSVTVTQASIPGQVSFEAVYFTANNGQSVQTRMLVDGTPTGQVFNIDLPRDVEMEVHYSWNPVLPLGTETITIEAQHSGNAAASVLGSVSPTTLRLLEPGGVAAAGASSTSYVVDRYEFWGRFLDSEKESLAKLLNRTKWAAPQPDMVEWLDVAHAALLVGLHTAQNVNLLDPETIDFVNWLETNWLPTEGIIAAGRAAIILTP